MGRVAKWLNYWGQLFLLPVYGISFLFPRDKRIWLFGSTFGRRFADNPRYFYQYCVRHKEELGIRPVWISHDKEVVRALESRGYEAYYFHSLKGIRFALSSGVYLYDNYSKDINFWQSGGALKVNMWHGIPLKKIQADNIHDRYRHPKNIWEIWRNFPRNLSDEKPSDYVLTTSESLRSVFSSAFRTDKVITVGYPRTDYLISEDGGHLLMPNEQDEIDAVKRFLASNNESHIAKDKSRKSKNESYIAENEKNEIRKNINKAKIVCYMPTFRDSEARFFDVVDLGRFHKYLIEENILFCVKLHPKSRLGSSFAEAAGSGFENILVMDAESDPYVILKMADILVTDYSSVFFDFLLLDRPVVFFDYDREEYITKSRELYFDYEEMTPGEKAETMEGLIGAIDNALYMTPEYKEKYGTLRKSVRDKVFETPMEAASPKLAIEIKKITG